MYVEAHELFKQFLAAMDARPEASIVDSLASSPKLGDFIAQLDPDMALDWSGRDFLGLPELREKVLRRSGTDRSCGIEDILITAGTAEANFLALSQLLQPGDELVVDAPGWPQPSVLAAAMGISIRPLQRREERAWRFDIAELEELVNEKTRLIFLCNPNNPTGQVVDEAELLKVIAIAERVGAWVLCDEVYAGLEWSEPELPRVANLYDRGISTGSVSKVLGLQGLRTGWLICRNRKLVFDAMVLREDTSEIMNVMGEAIADIALSEEYYFPALDRARECGRHNRKLLDVFVQGQDALQWHCPSAGLIGFCRLDLEINAERFARELMGPPWRTFVMPGSAYAYPQHLRLGFGGAQGSIAEGLQRMQKFLEQLESN